MRISDGHSEWWPAKNAPGKETNIGNGNNSHKDCLLNRDFQKQFQKRHLRKERRRKSENWEIDLLARLKTWMRPSK